MTDILTYSMLISAVGIINYRVRKNKNKNKIEAALTKTYIHLINKL